jgi:serine phosphatase RsbU (regulator of sigma subunit)
MATCRTLIRSAAGSGLSPGELLADVNDRLHPDIPAGMFVTCLVAYLDRATGFVVMANAGHNLPYLCETGSAKELMIRGMPLGLMPGMSYEPLDARIPDGASLVLSSDGFAGSHRQDGEMYGTERFQETLRRANGSHLRTAIDTHGGFVGSEWEQEDDMTLVTVTRS